MEPRQSNQDLKSQILNRIESDSLCPRSRLAYNSRECAVWGLWFLTVLIGAIAVAISLFVIMQRQYSFYEATHETFLSFVFEFIPYLWFTIFSLMVLLAVYNLRHTKTGYRYPLGQIFASSIVLSLAGGALLHLAGVGFSLDKQIGLLADNYQSQEKIEMRLWQQPNEGRLVGVLVSPTNQIPSNSVLFEDIEGVRFETSIEELQEADIDLLVGGGRVRVLGQIQSTEPPHFHACAVFPWVYEHEYSVSELSPMLNNMRQRVSRQKNKFLAEEGPFSDANKDLGVRCADMKMLNRLEPMAI